ncbi:hypothetical protein F4860DRAFT_521878 [Xylaria cubensis]|nr:hypothetical protein F4860DRAFT_521878 [Xylaria cubensis]
MTTQCIIPEFTVPKSALEELVNIGFLGELEPKPPTVHMRYTKWLDLWNSTGDWVTFVLTLKEIVKKYLETFASWLLSAPGTADGPSVMAILFDIKTATSASIHRHWRPQHPQHQRSRIQLSQNLEDDGGPAPKPKKQKKAPQDPEVIDPNVCGNYGNPQEPAKEVM